MHLEDDVVLGRSIRSGHGLWKKMQSLVCSGGWFLD